MATDAKRILRPPAAAAYVQRSPSNLAKLRMNGTGPRFIKMGALVGYEVADLDAWLDSLKRQRTGE